MRTSAGFAKPWMFLSILACAIWPAAAAAQTYPSRPITLIIPSSAGGSVDILNRLVAAKVSDMLGQPIVIDYRPGSGGLIGGQAISRAEPDGYTMGFMGSGLVAAQGLGKPMPFDVRDFVPVGQFFNLLLALNIKPALGIKTVAEFIALAKSQPGKLNFASSGYGGAPHIAAELFMHATGTKLTHIPYKGDPEAVQNIVSGQIDMLYTGTSASIPFHKGGQVQMIAVTGDKRLAAVPEVPTFKEANIEAAEYFSYNSWVLPPKTPPAIAKKLTDALMQAGKDEAIRKRFSELGVELVSVGPEDLSKRIKSELEKYQALSKAANFKLN